MEAHKMARVAERIASSLVEYFQASQFPYRCYNAVLSSTFLAKSLKTHIWNQQNQNIFNAMNIDEADSNKLIRAKITTLETLLQTNPREIEDVSIIYFSIDWNEIKLIYVLLDS